MRHTPHCAVNDPCPTECDCGAVVSKSRQQVIDEAMTIIFQQQEIESLKAKLAAAEKDAERWRKCVDISHGHSDEHGDFVMVQLPIIDGPFSSTEELFIATIDAAIAKEKE